MKQYVFLLLSTSPLAGIGALLFLLLLCFCLVHIAKLSVLGYRQYKTPEKDEPAERQTKKEEQKPLPAPIYYLVEKKRVRKKPKQEYEPPKRVNFEE